MTRVPLRCELAPERAVLTLRDEPHPFALLGDWAGGPALLGSAPLRVADATEDPFALLEELPPASGNAVVGGGWFGWLGYDLGRDIERLPPAPPRTRVRPRFRLAYYDHLVRFDGEQWWFEALETPGRAAELERRREHWAALLASDPQPRPASVGAFRLTGAGAAGHRIAVADCVERIAAGELFQANLSVRLSADVDGDLVDLAARAFTAARPRFGALDGGILSLSPERFLRRDGRAASTEPIKG